MRQIPALDVIFFFISARVLSPSGALQNHIFSTSELNFASAIARGFERNQLQDLNEKDGFTRSQQDISVKQGTRTFLY